jgi:uncharacterized linocin/CFP29 family protein
MLPNQQIFERGYMFQNEVLDPYAMRPYRNAQGAPVVSYIAGWKPVLANGKQVFLNGRALMEPVLKERQVFINALLRKYDWEQIDAELEEIHKQPLVGIDDLRADGLVHSLDGIGVSLTTYEQLGDMSPADVSMSLTPRKGENDRPSFEPVSIPVPIISKPFTLDLRSLSASGRNGHERLDTTGMRQATMTVREALEDILFNGSTVKSGDASIYGYTTLPQRDTGTATQYGGGDFATDTNGHKTLVGMIEALRAKGFRGPFRGYVANTQYSELLELTGANKTDTQLSVIQRTIPQLRSVTPSDRLDDGEVVVAQMTRDAVDLAVGQDITPVSWVEYGGMVNEFRVLGAMVPRIKYDANGNAGVAHATGA